MQSQAPEVQDGEFCNYSEETEQTKGGVKHALGFVQLNNMGSCQHSNDVEMPDFNSSILGKEDTHQNPKVEERLQAHE